MSNLHRMAWIDAKIRNHRYPNARTIAEHFEISHRQAQRDIEYLRYSMGAPVEYDAGKGGYYYTDIGFALPSHYITEQEKQALSYLASRYRMYGSGEAQQVAELFSRLTGGEAGAGSTMSPLPVFRLEAGEMAVFEQLEMAVSTRRKVRMLYRNADGQAGERTFHPYRFHHKSGVEYIVGFCEKKKEIRIFRLSRIEILKLTEENFEVVPYFKAEDYGPEGQFLFRTPYTARISFDRPIDTSRFRVSAVLMEDSPEDGPKGPDQVSKPHSVYTVQFYRSEELISELLSVSAAFTILFPGWLREKLRDRLEKIYRINFTATSCVVPDMYNGIVRQTDPAEEAG